MLKCNACGQPAGLLPEDVDLGRPWLRCRCGGRLVEVDEQIGELLP